MLIYSPSTGNGIDTLYGHSTKLLVQYTHAQHPPHLPPSPPVTYLCSTPTPSATHPTCHLPMLYTPPTLNTPATHPQHQPHQPMLNTHSTPTATHPRLHAHPQQTPDKHITKTILMQTWTIGLFILFTYIKSFYCTLLSHKRWNLPQSSTLPSDVFWL